MHDDEDNKLSDTLFVTYGGVLSQGYCCECSSQSEEGGGGGGVCGGYVVLRQVDIGAYVPADEVFVLKALNWCNQMI